MVTGVEAVSLILGTFPLVVECVKFYINGVQTMRDPRHHQHVLDELVRDLEVQECRFKNICFTLFEGNVTPEELTGLMRNPEEALRINQALQTTLYSCLYQHSTDPFIRTAEALKAVLGELRARFENENTKVRHHAVIRESLQKCRYSRFSQGNERQKSQEEIRPGLAERILRGESLTNIEAM